MVIALTVSVGPVLCETPLPPLQHPGSQLCPPVTPQVIEVRISVALREGHNVVIRHKHAELVAAVQVAPAAQGYVREEGGCRGALGACCAGFDAMVVPAKRSGGRGVQCALCGALLA